MCQGEIFLWPQDAPESAILGEVIDISSGGFRACYPGQSLPAGTEVVFRHRFFQGRARVIWSNPILHSTHSGFVVLRDC